MRKRYFLTILSIFLGLISYAQVTYTGNSNSGFGGTVGGSSLDISDNGTTITFEFSRGAGTVNNPVVIYIDSKTGGSANTSNFTDTGDGLRRAISTTNGANNPTVTFPAGFTADYAVAFLPGGGTDFGGIWELVESGSHTFVASADLTNSTDQSAATHSLTVDFTEIGITSTDKFDFVVTFIAESAWLSDEVIGDTSNITAGTGAGVNPGPDGSITFSGSRSYGTTTWTGSSGTDWDTSGNWSNGVPTSSLNAVITDLANDPIISGTTGAEVNNLSITGVDGLTISSGGSLRVSGTSSGNVTYNRTLGTSNWYLVGIPLAGETTEDMISNNTFDTGNGSNIGWAPYDNTQAASSDQWDYQTAASTGSLGAGTGYSVKLASAGTLTFEGFYQTADIGVSISDGTGSGGNAFNLVGNPYPSYLAANSNADATNNVLTVNSGSLTENTLWFWNQSTGSYDQINLASSAFFVAPGQGFFVSSTGSNTFNFTEAMQSHQSTDSFQRSADNTQVNLIIHNGTVPRKVELYFIDGTTTGWDNGYDSSIFGGVASDFSIYTEAVGNGTGRKLGIQSLPNSDYENMIVPVGVKSGAGTVTFSVDDFNLPAGYKVFLEDKDTGNFIRLDEEGSKYDVTFDNPVDGIGRFFLHMNTNALSTGSFDLTNISAYLSDSRNLRVVGIQSGTTQVRMFNILGKQVFNTSIQSKGVDNVSIPSLRQGVYVVQITSEQGTINKKVIIE